MSCIVKIVKVAGGVIEIDPSEVGHFFEGLKIVSNSLESNIVILHEATLFRKCVFNVNDGSVINLGKSRFGIRNLVVHANGGMVEIGDDFSCWGVNLRLQEKGSKITIGDDCMFSNDIVIYASDIHAILDLETGKVINRAKPVVINDHVWVGRNVSILKGVSLPENTIVGMGSVVTKSFSHGNISIAGNPAHIIKTNISWTRKHVDCYNETELKTTN